MDLGRKNDSYVGIYSNVQHSFRKEGAYAGRELVVDGNETVWLAECGSKREDGTFEHFARNFLQPKLRRRESSLPLLLREVVCQNLGLTDGFFVYGKAVPIPDALVSSPYLNSRYGSGRFNYTCPDFTVTQWSYPATE